MILTTALRAVALAALPFAFFACGEGSDDGGPTVVATTTQLTDIAQHLAGDRAQLVGLLPANADPHDYEPEPSDAEALIDSSLILKSGGEIDAWVDELIEGSGSDAPVVEVLDVVETIEGPDGSTDPHWWHDPRNALLAVEEITDELASVDPDGAAEYEANAQEYSRKLVGIDKMIASCMRAVPADRRKIVTGHDSLSYLADRYDIEVVGSALPALTTQAQASAGDISELVGLIRSERVSAVFGETGLGEDLVKAIAADAGAAVGDELFADSLAATGSASTYLGALTANARSLATGMNGAGVARC